MTVELFLGDCGALLPELMARQVEAVVTDPPYGIGAPSMTLGDGKKDFIRGDWDDEQPSLKPWLGIGRYHCIWGANYFSDQLPPSACWLIWDKKIRGVSFSEAELAWTDFSPRVRILQHHWSGEEKVHPTQKPLALMVWVLGMLPQDVTVLDPFMGAGTTGVACVQTGRNFIGVEIDPRYYAIAQERIANAKFLKRFHLGANTEIKDLSARVARMAREAGYKA
jgi:site-specific DNA-methyltransferase (adenine-specific)/modification methylase